MNGNATTDQKLLYLVVVILGVALVVALAGVVYLTGVDRGAPDVLVLVAGGCVTALAAVLPGARAAARTSDPENPANK